jgi:hypothetical protein
VSRAKDCKHICGEDGQCSGFDFNKDSGICRLWFSDLKEEGSGDENMECGIKKMKPSEDAPHKEKAKFAQIESAQYPRLKRIHI